MASFSHRIRRMARGVGAFFRPLEREDMAVVSGEMIELNLRRTALFAIYVLLVQFSNIVVDSHTRPHPVLQNYYNGVVIFLIAICLLFFLAYRLWARPGSHAVQQWCYRLYWLSYTLGVLCLTALDMVERGDLLNYYMLTLAIMVVPLLFPGERLALYALVTAAIVGVLFYTGQSAIAYQRALGSGPLAGLFFSQVLWTGRIRLIFTQKKLEEANTTLTALARTDTLTGLLNRRGLEELLADRWSICNRAKQEIAIIMLDIDFFKDYNDTFGHVAGDACLQDIAGCIRGLARRASDLVARVGGEEFLIVLGGTDEENSLGLARRIKDGVEQLEIRAANTSVSPFVTISLGVVTVRPWETEFGGAYKQVDRALYNAKNAGRNAIFLETT